MDGDQHRCWYSTIGWDLPDDGALVVGHNAGDDGVGMDADRVVFDTKPTRFGVGWPGWSATRQTY